MMLRAVEVNDRSLAWLPGGRKWKVEKMDGSIYNVVTVASEPEDNPRIKVAGTVAYVLGADGKFPKVATAERAGYADSVRLLQEWLGNESGEEIKVVPLRNPKTQIVNRVINAR